MEFKKQNLKKNIMPFYLLKFDIHGNLLRDTYIKFQENIDNLLPGNNERDFLEILKKLSNTKLLIDNGNDIFLPPEISETINYIKFFIDLNCNIYSNQNLYFSIDFEGGKTSMLIREETIFNNDDYEILFKSERKIQPYILTYWKYYLLYIDEEKDNLLKLDLSEYFTHVEYGKYLINQLENITKNISKSFKTFRKLHKSFIEHYILQPDIFIKRQLLAFFHIPISSLDNAYNKYCSKIGHCDTYHNSYKKLKEMGFYSKNDNIVIIENNDNNDNKSILKSSIQILVEYWNNFDIKSIIEKIKNLFKDGKRVSNEDNGLLIHIIFFIKVMYEILKSKYYVPFSSFVYIFYISGLCYYFGYEDQEVKNKISEMRKKFPKEIISIMDKYYDATLEGLNNHLKK